MKIKRRYVSQELYEDVIKYAKLQWFTRRTRAQNGKRLYHNFPESLDRYIAHLQN